MSHSILYALDIKLAHLILCTDSVFFFFLIKKKKKKKPFGREEASVFLHSHSQQNQCVTLAWNE